MYQKLVYYVDQKQERLDVMLCILHNCGLQVKGLTSGTALQKILNDTLPSLIVIHTGLMDIHWLDLLRSLKDNQSTMHIPVILFSNYEKAEDVIRGLDAGADDFIYASENPLILQSKVHSVLRRTYQAGTLTTQHIVLDTDKHRLRVNNEYVACTCKEFALLHYLMKHKGNVIPRDILINHVWGIDYQGDPRTLDVHIRTLRKKLSAVGNKITTVRGVGYQFMD